MRRGTLAAVLLAAAFLAGCAGGGETVGDGQAMSRNPAGGVTGGAMGQGLRDADRRKAEEAEYLALESGQTGTAVAWSGRRGVGGEVVPGPVYEVNQRECRDFTHVIRIKDRSESGRATACRDAERVWRPVS